MNDFYYNRDKECISKENLYGLQSKYLCKQISYVWKRQTPYRKKMEEAGVTPSDIKSIDDIVLLPFTEKEDLQRNYPYGMLASPKEDVIRVHATSGTTGNMTIVPCTKKDVALLTEGICRTYAMLGCKKGFVVQNAFSYSMFIGGMGAQNAVEKLGGTVIPTSTGNTRRQLQFLKDLKADNLSCTPSYALLIAKTLQDYGYQRSDFSLSSCLVAGERIKEEEYSEIEEKLGVKVFDVYGNAEMTNVFAPCKYNTGKHIPEDMIYAEIIDADGKPLPAGQAGELVVTTLQKTGVPLIRYRTHDIACLYDTPCPCGRTGRRLSKIFGRTDDMLTVRGCKIYPSQVREVLNGIPGLTGNYRLIVSKFKESDVVTVKAETKKDFSDDPGATSHKLCEAAKSILGISIQIELVPYGGMPVADGEKFKHMIDLR